MNFIQGLQESFPKTTMILTLIGFLIILKKIVNLLKKIRILLRKRKNLKERYGANSWAFVTGSSDGIGKEIAIQLAKQGFNVILSARTVKKLEGVKQEILKKYPQRQVEIIPADYIKATECEYIQNIISQIKHLDISIVVNNVGMDCLQLYHQQDPTSIENLIKLNCFSLAFFNRYFIPIMKERKINKGLHCAIMNVASIAGQIPIPYHNVYSASKAYVDNLSRALTYQNPQIDIMSLRPSEVSTPMTSNKDTDIFTISASDCAKGAINQLGYDSTTYGHWRHQIQGWIYEALPQQVFNYIFKNFFAPEEMGRRKAHQNKMK